MHVGRYKCNYIPMFFEDLSELRSLTDMQVVPYASVMVNTLLRHVLGQLDPSESVTRTWS